MVNKFLPISLLAASALFATPDFGFQGDTTLTLGEKSVPLAIETTMDTINNDTFVVYDTLYTDSIGRLLKSDERVQGLRDSITYYNHGITSLDLEDKVLFRTTQKSMITPGFNSTGVDSLIGESWNSSGEIEKGWLVRKKTLNSSEHGSFDFVDSQSVEISYDSTNVNPTGTVVLSKTGFIADTLLTAGALVVPVKDSRWKSGKGGAPWTSASSRNFYDSIGRKIKGYYRGSSGKSNSRWSESIALSLDDSNQVAIQIYNESSSAMSHSTSLTDSLVGEKWNSKGMITKGNVNRSVTTSGKGGGTKYSELDLLIAYDSAGLIAVDSFVFTADGFQPDHIYKAGDLHVPVIDLKKDYVTKGNFTDFRDSLGRNLYYADHGYKSRSYEYRYMELDSSDRVRTLRYSRGFSGTNTSHSINDTLVGKSWNSKGMILDAEYYRHFRDANPGGLTQIDTLYEVTIVYDSTDVTPIDTLFHSQTAILSTVTQKAQTFTAQLEQSTLSLGGLKANEMVKVISANGRVLLQGQACERGALRLPVHSLSSGVHFLITQEKRMRFVK